MDELDKLIKSIKHHRDNYYYIVEGNYGGGNPYELLLLLKASDNEVNKLFGTGIVKNAYIEIDSVYSDKGYCFTSRMSYEDAISELLINLEVRCNEVDVNRSKGFTHGTLSNSDGDVFIEFVNGKIIVIRNYEYGSIWTYDEYVD